MGDDRAGDAAASGHSARYFRALIENATDLIAVLEHDGTIRFMSDSVVRILGHQPSELIGTNAFELVHPDDRADVVAAIQAGLEHRDTGLPMTFKVRHRDGSWRFLEATDRNLLDEPAVAGIVINGRDVTERVHAEEELRDNDRRKDEFLAMLAHELRNPLAPIRSAAEVLRMRGREDPRLIAWATDVIARQVQHLARLVDDLLDVARITRGTIGLERETLDLGQIVSRAVEMTRPLIDARGHELTVLLPLERLRVDADPVRLPQVLANILTNAAKYTDDGGRIRVTVEHAGGEADIRIEDTGVGISPTLLPRIFDLFMQADHSLARAQGGLGVGLSLARRLVEMHGGRIEAHSDGPGRGSAFVVRVPLARDAPAEAPALPSTPAPEPPPCRILVVDDNLDAAESLAVMLQLMGHQVETEHGGAAAIRAACRSAPDLVLLDIGLPGLDGYEVARRLRAHLGTAPMLVAVTGYGQEEDRLRSREAGFDHHVVKPVEESALRQLTRECVARATLSRDAQRAR